MLEEQYVPGKPYPGLGRQRASTLRPLSIPYLVGWRVRPTAALQRIVTSLEGEEVEAPAVNPQDARALRWCNTESTLVLPDECP